MYGKIIRELREEKGWTQTELAKRIGTTQKNISKYELEFLDLSTELLLKLSQIFSVSTDFILGQENDFGVVIQTAPNNKLNELEEKILSIVREYPKGYEEEALRSVQNGLILAQYKAKENRGIKKIF